MDKITAKAVFNVLGPINHWYQVPTCSEEETQPIGLWGQRHKQYLKEHRHIVYTTMLIDGTLNRYLADINQ